MNIFIEKLKVGDIIMDQLIHGQVGGLYVTGIDEPEDKYNFYSVHVNMIDHRGERRCFQLDFDIDAKVKIQ